MALARGFTHLGTIEWAHSMLRGTGFLDISRLRESPFIMIIPNIDRLYYMRSSRILQRSDPSAAQNDARFLLLRRSIATPVRRSRSRPALRRCSSGRHRGSPGRSSCCRPWSGRSTTLAWWLAGRKKKGWSNWWSKQPNLEVEWKLKQIWRLSENWEYLVSPIRNHPHNQFINHSQMVGFLLGFPHY